MSDEEQLEAAWRAWLRGPPERTEESDTPMNRAVFAAGWKARYQAARRLARERRVSASVNPNPEETK